MKAKLILFSSRGCSVCSALKPKLEYIARRFKVQFESVLIDESPEFAASRLILSAPAVILEIDGKEANRWAGVFSTSEIESFLRRVL